VIGAGVTLLGIFLMGVGGAWDAHYLFNFGVLTAVTGAILFVLFVTLTALRQRRSSDPPA
jgi:Flp pilus assembly protein protease CpaA